MTKVLTVSRTFPAFHPKAGQPTHFVEKLIESFLTLGDIEITDEQLKLCSWNVMRPDVWEKWHTIRVGNNWKVGDTFSPRVWSGKPYNSPQITIAPDIRVEKVWPIEMYIQSGNGVTQLYIYNVCEGSKHKTKWINGTVKEIHDYYVDCTVWHRNELDFNNPHLHIPLRNILAKNDGLSIADFADWFLLSPDLEKGDFGVFDRKFSGQIICWNKNIKY